ncbi:inositol monophosphatase 2 [Monosporozyma unispora]|nr:Inositol monophosphatase [Kazachstania unispora]
MSFTSEELKSIETFIVNLLHDEVGPIIKSETGTTFQQYVDKANAVDLVTKYDKQIEQTIKEKIYAKYGDKFKFIGEEEYVPGETKITNDPTFILDPIDGTTNFIHAFPFSCCSLGLAVNGHPVVGVVYNPHLNQLFHASKGNGAFVNNDKINVKTRPLILQKSVVGLEGGADRKEGPDGNFDKKMTTYRNLLRENGGFIHGFRSLGSAALNVCYTASGILDAYWEGGCYAWDVCAGWCILEEAGGRMFGGNPGDWEIPIDKRCYLAVRGGCNGKEQEQLVKDFWAQVAGDLDYSS